MLRTRRRVRHSLYEALREERRRQIEQVRAGPAGRSPGAVDDPPADPPADAPADAPADPPEEEPESIQESLAQLVTGHLALVGALVAILLGVVVLLGVR